jgi:histidinol-phosphate aminotransferase
MSFIQNWMRDDILALNSYKVQGSDNKLKLDAMESPFSLSENTQNELADKLKSAEINRYPANHLNLKNTIKDLMDIPQELEIMLGNGSDELIQLLMLGCENSDKILGFSPSFVMYEMIAKWCKLDFLSIDLDNNLDNNFDIDLDIALQKIEQENPKIIFIAYPNNPTGNNFDRKSIAKIIKNSQGLVVVDEAYYAYSDDSFIDDIQKYDNLIVLRTISKIGFAGLRLGVMIGKSEVISEFDKLRMPYNINTLTMIASEFLLSKKDEIIKNSKIIKEQRKIIFDKLNNFPQITAFKSDANFILFKTENSNELFDFLLKNNLLIKNMGDELLRVTISTADENQQFVDLVNKFYRQVF